IFSGSCFPFWNRPHAIVFTDEKWSTRVRQQNFDFVILAAKQKQTGADPTSCWHLFSALRLFCRARMCRGRSDISFAPDMKCVSENYVAHQVVIRTVINIQRRIELKIWCYVAGKPDSRRIFGAALPIDLQPPSLIEIVRVAEVGLFFLPG